MSLNRKIISTYFRAAWKYPGEVIAVFVSVTFAVLTLDFIPPLLAANILDRLSDGDFEGGGVWESFGPELLLYGTLTFLGGVIGWRLVIWFIWRLEIKVETDLYRMQYDHLLKLSAKYHADSFGGSIVSHTSKFTRSYIRLADTLIFQIYTTLLAFATSAIILWPRAPEYVIALFVLSLIFVITSTLLTKKLRVLHTDVASSHNRVTGVLADGISNIMAVKSYAAQKQENKRYSGSLNNYKSSVHAVIRESMIKETYFSVITSSITVAALVFAVYSVVVLDSQIGTVFLVLAYTTNLTRRLWEFSQNTLKNINIGLGDASDGMKTLETTLDVSDPEHPEMSMIHEGAIELNEVSFTHDSDIERKALFNKLSVSIKPGEKIGLVGQSGSGKSTLVSLLLRFMDIDSGSIEIDGQNIASITQDDLRKNIAYVPQEPLLFHRSIAENIGYSAEEPSEKQIIKAAKQANAHEFIKELPEGYKTLVGERGVKLSGGQRQRIAIARALMKDAPILLLDEATSALDSESEQLIQDALWKLMKGRTAIVIAHRLSTIQKMDRIFVMHAGEIVESGTHNDLLKLKGRYADLWAHQSGGFVVD